MNLFLDNTVHYILFLFIGTMVRVFDNGPGEWGSIPDKNISKIPKTVLDATLLNTQHYDAGTNGMWRKTEKGKVPFSTSQKGSFPVTLDYGRLTDIYIYIYNVLSMNKFPTNIFFINRSFLKTKDTRIFSRWNNLKSRQILLVIIYHQNPHQWNFVNRIIVVSYTVSLLTTRNMYVYKNMRLYFYFWRW